MYIGVELIDELSNIKQKNAIYDDWHEGFDNNSDYFVVEIDSEHNHQQSFCFAVNSSGVKSDFILHNDNSVDEYWNSVYWNAKTNVSNNGWVIEYEIPFKILKYFGNSTMGINFMRFSHSDKETHFWVLLPMELDGTVSHYGHIKNLTLPNDKIFQINPYIVSGSAEFKNKYYGLVESMDGDIIDTSNLINDFSNIGNLDRLGVDINYSPSSFLNLSYTHNPDFGQINQINSYVNFSSFEQFYEERRPFFSNNSKVYSTPINIFYSQRIGSNVVYENQLYNVNIKDAFRIDGIGNENFDYGILYVDSQIDKSFNQDYNKKIKTIVGRVRKNLVNDNSHIGFTNSIYEDFKDLSKVYSIDALFSLLENRLKIDGQIALSNIDSTQNGFGYSYEISYRNKINDENRLFFNNSIIDFWLNHQIYDEQFYINHVGYLDRNDIKKQNIGIAITKNNPNPKLISRSINLQHTLKKNINNDNLGQSFTFNWQSTFKNNYSMEFSLSKLLSHYDDWLFLDLYSYDYFSYNEVSPIVKIPESNHFNISFATDPTFNFYTFYNIVYFNDKLNDSGIGHNIYFNYKPNQWLSMDLDFDIKNKTNKYNFLKRRRSFVPDLGNAHRLQDNYLFSDSEIFEKQLTLSLSSSFLNNFNIQIFSSFYTHDNYFDSSIPYSKLSSENNYMYPEMEELPTSSYESDILLYGANYSSVEFNFILKWEFDRRINLYFVYSQTKGVNGEVFNSISDFISYDFKDNGESELFFDKSLLLKFDFMLDI